MLFKWRHLKSKVCSWRHREGQRSPGYLIVKANLSITSRNNYARMSSKMCALQHGSSCQTLRGPPSWISLALLVAPPSSAFLVLVGFSQGLLPARIQLLLVRSSSQLFSTLAVHQETPGELKKKKKKVPGPYSRPVNFESLLDGSQVLLFHFFPVSFPGDSNVQPALKTTRRSKAQGETLPRENLLFLEIQETRKLLTHKGM